MPAESDTSTNQTVSPDEGSKSEHIQFVPVRESPPQIAAELEEVEKDLSRFELATLRWTRASFFIVLATAIFIGLQWLEMRSSSADTRAMAKAAEKQAEAAGKQADQAKEQAERLKESVANTKDLVSEATEQAKATNRLAEEAKRSADISQGMFDASVRPYIGLDSIAPPIFIDQSHIIRIRAATKNFGSAPAEQFTVEARWFLNDSAEIKPHWRGDILKKTLFPGQPMEHEITFDDPVLYQEIKSGANLLSVCFTYRYTGPKNKHYEETQSAAYIGMSGPLWSNWGECPARSAD